jgi:O-antigen/teichoic acid export membrane protein
MTGRFIVHVIAVIGWLFAAVFAYAFLMLFGFFGVGFYGLLLLFICMQVELEPAGNLQHKPRPLGVTYGLFFKILGIGLAIVGFSGFLFFQLD